MSVKMAARLAAASPDPKLVLLRLDYDAGHGIGSSTAQRRAEFVDTLTFMGWQFGEHGFQPAPH
jgi:prolyl oligopeptidase